MAGLRTTAGVRSRAETVSIENGLVTQRVLEADSEEITLADFALRVSR